MNALQVFAGVMTRKFTVGKPLSFLAATILLLSVPGVEAVSAETAAQVAPKGVTRRLTPLQYRNIIDEVFGPSIELGGRFEPDVRVDNLIEIGTTQVSVSAEGMAQFDAMARSIASQVTGPTYRDIMIPCKPKVTAEADDTCAGKFLGDVGRLLFRRSLTPAEHRSYVNAAAAATKETKDFYSGLSLALAALLESPQFLFRQITLEPDPSNRGQFRLDSLSKATRLSFFLWNSMPDDLLLVAAEKGELHSASGLARQTSRMLASPRVEAGVRAFFSDMLQLDGIASLAKDTTLYPKFDSIVTADAEEQTLRTIVDLVVRKKGDYRDLFTTRHTFLTQALASVYDVPLVNNVPNGSPDIWQAYDFSSDDPRAGILTHLSFVALHSHPGRSSPTLRGKALREVILCQRVPAPPADVNFTIVQDTSNPIYKTARDRLIAHRTNPVCAGCHKLVDPMGLALEAFDGGGGYRTAENGTPIDGSGDLEGVKFTNAAELGQVIRNNPATSSCVIDRLAAYSLGRVASEEEASWVAGLKTEFSKNKYNLIDVLGRIVRSPEFFRTGPSLPAAVKVTAVTP